MEGFDLFGAETELPRCSERKMEFPGDRRSRFAGLDTSGQFAEAGFGGGAARGGTVGAGLSAIGTAQAAGQDGDTLPRDAERARSLLKSQLGMIDESLTQAQAELLRRQIDTGLRQGDVRGNGVRRDLEGDQVERVGARGSGLGDRPAHHPNLRTGTP
jgi:hypothetical protein